MRNESSCCVCGGLKGGNGGGRGRSGFFFLDLPIIFLLHHFFEEEPDGAFAFGVAYFGSGSKDAESWVDDDLFYSFDEFRFGVTVGGLRLGQVEAGDLEAVE